jgi:hypothetical protein
MTCPRLLVTSIVLFTAMGLGRISELRGDEAKAAKGVVFVDANHNRKLDAGEKPLPGIRVSNGREIVRTGEDGSYQIQVDDDDIIFVIKPRGYRTPLSPHNLPQFYYIHKPAGSPQLKFAGVAPTGPLPESIDFPLYPQDEPDQFRAILFGDPQPRNQKEVDYIAHDVVQELIGSDASLGVTLGDIVFDDLNVFESLNRTIALIGIPWYNVIGNHDINYDASHDRHSDETFERHFGPSYYSFDYGQVHFIALDDIQWIVPEDGNRPHYRGGLGAEQMEFIRNDLAEVPDEQLIVLLMHIPLVDVADRQELYRLIEQRPLCISISGHTHYHEHRFIAEDDGWRGPKPHHHIINVTVCGSWWGGAPDERGIPHTTMADGAPNGYSIMTFDGTNYSLRFKAAGRDPDYQMEIRAPDVVAARDCAATNVYVNVFNGSEHSRVEMRVGEGEWRDMVRSVEIDPGYQAVFDAEAELLPKEGAGPWRKLAKPRATAHLWKAPLPEGMAAGTHLIQIRTTSSDGQHGEARRVIRVEEAEAK